MQQARLLSRYSLHEQRGLVARLLRDGSLAEFTTAALAEQPVRVACVLERLPIVMPGLPQWEVEYKQWAHQRKDKKAKGQEDQVQARASEEEEDSGKKLHQPAPRVTSADASDDRRTMKRRLSEHLYLVVKGPDGGWAFPQAEHAAGETIRDTAAKALHSAIGRERRLHFIGNSPMAHLQPSTGGTPLFFLLSQILQDPWQVKLQTDAASDFAWVTKDEFSQYFEDQDYRTVAEQML